MRALVTTRLHRGIQSMKPRERGCDKKIWFRNFTRLSFGLAYTVYILLVTMLLAWTVSILGLSEPIFWGMWSAIVVYGAPSGLFPGSKRFGISRVLRNIQSNELHNSGDRDG